MTGFVFLGVHRADFVKHVPLGWNVTTGSRWVRLAPLAARLREATINQWGPRPSECRYIDASRPIGPTDMNPTLVTSDRAHAITRLCVTTVQ